MFLSAVPSDIEEKRSGGGGARFATVVGGFAAAFPRGSWLKYPSPLPFDAARSKATAKRAHPQNTTPLPLLPISSLPLHPPVMFKAVIPRVASRSAAALRTPQSSSFFVASPSTSLLSQRLSQRRGYATPAGMDYGIEIEAIEADR